MQKHGERFYEAELYRLKGELLLKSKVQGPESEFQRLSEAEACFYQALDIARRQSTKSWELRAAMRLSRLWRRQGKIQEARQGLREPSGAGGGERAPRVVRGAGVVFRPSAVGHRRRAHPGGGLTPGEGEIRCPD